jgi:hypothetical protein
MSPSPAAREASIKSYRRRRGQPTEIFALELRILRFNWRSKGFEE